VYIFSILHPKVPYVLTLQEGDPVSYIKKKMLPLHPLFVRGFRKACVIQAISTFLGRWAKDMGFQGPIEVIPNAVDISKFSRSITAKNRALAERKLGKTKGDIYVITTSRLVKKNAIDDVIEALVFLPKNIHFAVLGTGPDEKALKQLVRDRGMTNRVHFLGHVDHKDIPSYLTAADIFIRPSLSEGMGSSFIEAMAARVPVIATQVGGISDFLFDPERNPEIKPTGRAVKVHDPQGIAAAIEKYIKHPKETKNIVANAYVMVSSRYDWNLIASDMETRVFRKLYKQNQTKRILIATGLYPPDVGGPATYAKLLHSELPKCGIETAILSFGTVRYLPIGVRHFVYFFKLLRAGRNADVIFALDSVSVGLPSRVAALVLKKRFILKVVGDYAWEQGVQRFNVTDTLHDFLQSGSKYNPVVRALMFIERWVAKGAETVIVPSEYLKNVVRCWGIGERKIRVIYNGFTPPQDPGNKDTLRGLLQFDGKFILSAGRLVPWKGFDALIHVVSEMHKEIPDIKLVIVGSGPDQRKLERQIKERRAEEFVVLAGPIDRDILLRYIRAADVFVLNTSYEGFSHQLLEVMAVGTPLITTSVGGNIELVEDKKDGLLVSHNNKQDLTSALATVLGDRAFSKQLSSNAFKKVEQFSEKRMISELIDVLV
jgi:glycosyltransferase involved in cell wall biosynthesis